MFDVIRSIIYSKESEFIERLESSIESGADVNQLDVDGCTPLWLLAIYSAKMVSSPTLVESAFELLLKAGADINHIYDFNGYKKTYNLYEVMGDKKMHILNYVVENHDHADVIVALMVKYGVDVNMENLYGRPVLSLAIERYLKCDYLESDLEVMNNVIIYLILAGADLYANPGMGIRGPRNYIEMFLERIQNHFKWLREDYESTVKNVKATLKVRELDKCRKCGSTWDGV